MPYVDFVSDQDLEAEVRLLITKARDAKKNVEKNFGKNVIDPFSALFEIAGFGIDHGTWRISEMTRQSQKTLQNHIGSFHQNLLGKVSGWKSLGVGSVIDLVNSDRKIIAEIKNKYNTISGGKLSELYDSLDKLVMPKASIYKDFTAYYVTIIPKRPIRHNRPFTPSDKGKGSRCPENHLIREIDGSSFYHLVTGEANALKQLYAILPTVIESIMGHNYSFQDVAPLIEYFDQAFG